ncbi:MAG: RNA-directed DNA polymerase [Planctomycetes bacterium]|nr:RNA-directed DNA polymerase [Planctomycetota bacterium]
MQLLFGAPPRPRPAARPPARPAPAAPNAAAPTSARPEPRPAPPRPADVGHRLEAPNLTPLAASELKRSLRQRGQSSWAIFGGASWWGRRDLVPPSTDERTNLIDRGMVGRGLTTVDELAAMHRVGDEMLRLDPRRDGGAAAGEAAVQADRAERARVKQQKKEEAARRRAERAAAVAARRANDIGFLGRGVSKGLADRSADAARLGGAGLPVLATPADVAAALQLPIPQLRWLAFHAEATERPHYVRFTVPKRSGGTRDLAAPMPRLRATQDWILANVLAKVPTHAAAHGFVPGRSTVSNAAPHLRPLAVVNCDLQDFFPTIHVHRVRGCLEELGYSSAAATILALLCTEAPRRLVEYAGRPLHVATGPRCLPQGAPTSPALSNLIARRLDARCLGIARKLGFTYTRYADDLTFSTTDPEALARIGYLLARIRHIAQDEGFALNEKKTRVLRPSCSQRVTGIVVNGDQPRIPRATVRRLRAILHQAEKTGLEAQNRDGHPDFANHVAGMLAWVRMVSPQQAEPLVAAWRRARRNDAG